MTTCIACGADRATEKVLATYDDDAIGIPVTIKNAVIRHECEECGFSGVEIPDPEGLEAAIAVARILIPVALSGQEIKFLRKVCGMNGKEFATFVGIDNATLSRWENSTTRGLGTVSEKSIRDAVAARLGEKTPAINLKAGQFVGMQILRLPEGQEMPRIVMERVRLKDCATQTKSDQWDIYDQAA